MKRLARWYGANPLHLLALLGCFALAGYAAARLVPSRPLGVAVWFLGAVIGHDLLLMPLYSLADRSAVAAMRHRAPRLPAVPWINYLRVPAGLSGLLLLVWFPLILRLRTDYHASTTLSPDPFLWHWLAVTGALFLLSAAMLALRLRRTPHPAASPPTERRGEKNTHTPPGPVPSRSAGQPPRTARPGTDEPAPARLLPPRPGAADNDIDDHAADSGKPSPLRRSQAASPADQGNRPATGGPPAMDQETPDSGHQS
jgi:hypothetical protein